MESLCITKSSLSALSPGKLFPRSIRSFVLLTGSSTKIMESNSTSLIETLLFPEVFFDNENKFSNDKIWVVPNRNPNILNG